MISENVQLMQRMIDALPAADALNADNMAAVYQKTEAAYTAYLALSHDEQEQITGAEKFAALFAVFNAQTTTLEETETVSFTARDAIGTTSSYTATAGTIFLTYASSQDWVTENCLWKVVRGGKLGVDAPTAIQDGDDYQLLWSIYNQMLLIYPGCTQADLPPAAPISPST